MENEEQALEPQVETEATTETVEVVEDEVVEVPVVDKDAEARRQLTARAKAAEARAKAAEEQLRQAKSSQVPLAVDDYIDISTALDGLDQREKARLAEEHRLSGRPLKDIREGEDFQLWQSAYRAKIEKELALKPSSTQAIEEVPKSVGALLRNASLAEQEELLRKAGLYKETRPRADRVDIGPKRSR